MSSQLISSVSMSRPGAQSSFRYVDLFAGIGGFHAALSALGGECVYVSEIDDAAATVYQHNWGTPVAGDIVEATENRMDVPEHDVLAAGFPCQPFSKSGYQRGMEETRGTLFYNICRVLEERSPSVVLLENVRNLAGPRHRHEWAVIIDSLRQLGYRVSDTPTVFSPHLLPPDLGGRPQIRERVFILATRVDDERREENPPPVARPLAVDGWDPQRWSISDFLDDDPPRTAEGVWLTADEVRWIDAWDDFVQTLRKEGRLRLPGFPIWADHFVHTDDLMIEEDTPAWKADFLRKNAALYTQHRAAINKWLARWGGLESFPPSRRKLEWQAQETSGLWDTVMHFRPSGIRAKKATYLPALVAITQTSIIGARRRRLTVREAARLQGLPDWFDLGEQRTQSSAAVVDQEPFRQPHAAAFKQLGNGVNIGAAYHVFRQHILNDRDILGKKHPLVKAVQAADPNPDTQLELTLGPGSGARRALG